jgi:diguanylate cyclase (GGDEF)-like protein/PAS domain S-box-containing protein
MSRPRLFSVPHFSDTISFMDDPLGYQDPIQRVPGLWNRLSQSGFFLADYVTGESTVSRFMSSLGFQPPDFIETKFTELIHPADRATYHSLWGRVSSGQEDDFYAEYRIRTRRGGYRWVQTIGLVLQRQPDGSIALFFGLDRDIGLKKQSETLLHNRFIDLERRYLMSESLRVAGSMVTASLDLESTIPVILEQAGTLFPFTEARVWAYREETLELLGREEENGSMGLFSPSTGNLVLRVAREKTPLIIDNLASRLGSQEDAHQASWLGIPLLYQGETRGVMEFWHDQSGFFRSDYVWPAMAFADNVAIGLFNAHQYRATQEASETDPLTGLATRRRLERLGPKLFQEALNSGEDLTVFMVDLDFFKIINDNFGHAQGDAVLRHFARTCQSVLRKGDLICRYGGDEFVAILPRIDQENALLVAERLRELFKNQEFPFSNHQVSLSLGISSLKKGHHSDVKDLLEAADTALYRVKARGRDGIEIHNPSITRPPSLPSSP